MARIQTTAERDMAVIYIGKKKLKREKTFQTKLVFYPGQVHMIRADIAQKLLAYPDVYTTFGTPEFDKFVENNRNAAAKWGLIDVDADEKATLQAEQDKADKAAAALAAEQAKQIEVDDGLIAPNTSNESDDDLLLADAKAEIVALSTKGEIQQWVDENEMGVTLKGTRDEFTEQALDAYAQSLKQADE